MCSSIVVHGLSPSILVVCQWGMKRGCQGICQSHRYANHIMLYGEMALCLYTLPGRAGYNARGNSFLEQECMPAMFSGTLPMCIPCALSALCDYFNSSHSTKH